MGVPSRTLRKKPNEVAPPASAKALRTLAELRHRDHWVIAGVERLPGFLDGQDVSESPVELPAPTEGDDIAADYESVVLTLRRHPMTLLRPHLEAQGILTAEAFAEVPNGARADVAGLATVRQRPSTANGVIFVTFEDETGSINVIVWPKLVTKSRQAVRGARLMRVKGVMQREGEVRHCVARSIEACDKLLGDLSNVSRDFQ